MIYDRMFGSHDEGVKHPLTKLFMYIIHTYTNFNLLQNYISRQLHLLIDKYLNM